MTFIFDFDGVLVDSMPVWAGTYVKLMDENHVPYSEDFVKTFTPLGNAGAAKLCIRLGLKMSVEEILDYAMKVYKKEYTENIQAKNNVVNTVRKLKEQGNNLAVLTASSHSYLDDCLKRIGIFDCFTKVWSVDEFPYTKADPEIYKIAADLLETEPGKCYFLDDNINAIASAKMAGMMTIGVFDESSRDMKEKMHETADFYIEDFGELENIQ